MVAVETIRMVENPPPGAERKVGVQVRHLTSSTSSDAPDARTVAAVRTRRAIENGLRSRCSTRASARTTAACAARTPPPTPAVLCRIALDLVRTGPSRGSPKSKRKRAAWDDGFMPKIVAGIVHA
jgi:hypothetical protein